MRDYEEEITLLEMVDILLPFGVEGGISVIKLLFPGIPVMEPFLRNQIEDAKGVEVRPNCMQLV